jgi:predicted Ser/Thr protein kinase
VNLATKYLAHAFTSIDELTVQDISGMSNETYVISAKNLDISQLKIVIRFFKSKASDFELESRIFRHLGMKGLGPKELELTSVYRVEEYIDGRPLTFLELRNPVTAKQLMKLLS